MLDGYIRCIMLESDDRFFFLLYWFFMLKVVVRFCEEYIFCFIYVFIDLFVKGMILIINISKFC